MATAVGKKFPNLSVDAMNEMGDTFKVNVLEEAIQNKKKVLLFWYPKDFTFVCPTELHAFQAALGEFEKRNTVVIGASCDTPEVHFAWLSTSKDNGGIEGVTYPILADSNRNLSSILGILDITNETYDEATGSVQVEGDNVTYRATYLIDEEGTVFHEGINHMQLVEMSMSFYDGSMRIRMYKQTERYVLQTGKKGKMLCLQMQKELQHI